MGLFDFLKPSMRATGGGFNFSTAGLDPNTAMVRQEGAGGFMKTMPQLEKQSFADRMKGPATDGSSLGDRALMALLALKGDAGAALQMRQGLRSEKREDSEREARNAALKAAYDPETGKFNRERYMEAMGPMGDARDALSFEKAMRPEVGVDGGFSYTVGPDGTFEWGEQRAPSYSERVAMDKQEDPLRDELVEAQIAAYQALAEQRRNQGDYYGAKARQPYAPPRPPAGGKGGPPAGFPPLPPGFRPVTP